MCCVPALRHALPHAPPPCTSSPPPASPSCLSLPPWDPQVKQLEGYCVVSLNSDDGGAPLRLGFLPATDFNLQGQQHGGAARQFAPGDTLPATVVALPSVGTGGRMLLSAPLTAKLLRAAGGKAQQGEGGATARHQQPGPAVGAVVEATVTAVHVLHADLVMLGDHQGRLHITEGPGSSDGDASPLAGLAAGQKLPVAVLGRVAAAEGRRHAQLHCSARPEVLAAARAGKPLPPALSWGRLRPGQQLAGWVAELDAAGGHVWCAFSPAIRGRADATQVGAGIWGKGWAAGYGWTLLARVVRRRGPVQSSLL